MGLTQSQAQKLVDLNVAAAKSAPDPMKAYNDMRADWQTKTKSDPDIAKVAVDGKTGLDAVKINVAKVYAALDPALVSEFKTFMNVTGGGDHPAAVKFMNAISAFITEGKHVSGSGPSTHGQQAPGAGAKPTAAAALYPNLAR